jgi:hypothetical protein
MQHIKDYNLPSVGHVRRVARAQPRVFSWAMVFIVFEIICQLSLLFNTINAVRVVVRSLAYGISLILLFLVPKFRRVSHPSAVWAIIVLTIAGIETLHPSSVPLAAIAQWTLYLSVLSPIFWASRQEIDIAGLRKVILVLWVFHVASSAIGILQVLFPGSFEMNLASVATLKDEALIEAMKITTASGARVFRPMGLTDAAGGAASAGFYATVIGTMFLLNERRWQRILIYLGGMLVGLTVIYLSQVRSALVMTLVCVLVFIGISAYRRPSLRLVRMIVLTSVITISSLAWALYVGGEDTQERLATLISDSPSKVYYVNRGQALQDTFTTLLVKYPFGAGLGRWGMISAYFGRGGFVPGEYDLWAEIQLTGWLYDGGFLMIFAYMGAIMAAIWTTWRIAMSPELPGSKDLWVWGALLLAYDIGAVSLIFTGIVFASQIGIEFWVLNGSLLAVYKFHRQEFGRARATHKLGPTIANGFFREAVRIEKSNVG